MSTRAFSERAANQFLQKVLHAPPGDETAAMLAKDWRAVAEAHFTFTPDQRRVLDAVPSEASELIQSTLATALGRRDRAPAGGLKVQLAEAPPSQTRPVDIRVERASAERGAADPMPDDAARDGEGWEIFVLWVLIVGAIVCNANN